MGCRPKMPVLSLCLLEPAAGPCTPNTSQRVTAQGVRIETYPWLRAAAHPVEDCMQAQGPMMPLLNWHMRGHAHVVRSVCMHARRSLTGKLTHLICPALSKLSSAAALAPVLCSERSVSSHTASSGAGGLPCAQQANSAWTATCSVRQKVCCQQGCARTAIALGCRNCSAAVCCWPQALRCAGLEVCPFCCQATALHCVLFRAALC